MAIRPPSVRPALFRMPWTTDYPTCRPSQVSATSIPPSKPATMAAVRARTAARRSTERLRKFDSVAAISTPI